MRNNRALKVLKIAAFIVAASALFGFAVMALWNWLAPAVFGGHRIDYWQALGLFLLCKILFGGFHGRGGRGNHWRHRMQQRWESMPAEEREKFRARMGDRCGHFRPSVEPQPRAEQFTPEQS